VSAVVKTAPVLGSKPVDSAFGSDSFTAANERLKAGSGETMHADPAVLMIATGLALGAALMAVAVFDRWNKNRP